MLKWINPLYWGYSLAMLIREWEDRQKAEQLLYQAELMFEEALHMQEGRLKDATNKVANELVEQADRLTDRYL